MEILVNVCALVLVALIHASLQLGQGTFLILYHASATRHFSAKTRNLVGSFVSGVGLVAFFGLVAMCFLLVYLDYGALAENFLVILIVLLLLLALFMWLFYYRKGDTTELWVPRPVAKFVTARAHATKSNTEAFSLAVLISILEFPLSAVLLAVAADNLLAIPEAFQLLGILCYAIVVMLPLMMMQLCFKSGKTVVDVQRWRAKNKNFLRIVSGAGLTILAIFIFVFEIIK